MSTVYTRATKGSALTWTEGDANITNLNTDKIEDIVEDTTPQLGGNLDVNGNSIVSTSNANIVIEPNGTGDVQLNADLVRVGDSNANATITTNGTGDLILSTNSGSNSGVITILDGLDNDITLVPAGTGKVHFETSETRVGINDTNAKITTKGTGDLTLDTNSGTNSGSIVIADGVNGNISLTPNGSGKVIISNLQVDGTTTTVNSTTVTVDDPIFTLGGDTAPASDDNKDRGIEFRYYNGTAKVGFFGYDDSTGYLTFIPDATNTSEVFSGTQGDIQAANFRGALIGNADTATTATSAGTLTTTRAIYGNNFDGSAALTQVIASTYGGTGNGFAKFSGPTTSEKTFTLPDASSTIVVQGGALGTPSSGTLANATGLPVGTGISGLGSGVATFLATPSSANLISAVTDETGTGALVFATSPTLVTPALGTPASGNLTNTTVDGTNPVGFRDLPAVGTKTSSYTLATGDVGKYVQVGSGGSITIPNSTFAEGDVVVIANNHTAAITITCSITDAYIAGTDTDKATVSLATRGVCNILFLSGTRCIITGNVT